jgi:hypothetical protein
VLPPGHQSTVAGDRPTGPVFDPARAALLAQVSAVSCREWRSKLRSLELEFGFSSARVGDLCTARRLVEALRDAVALRRLVRCFQFLLCAKR